MSQKLLETILENQLVSVSIPQFLIHFFSILFLFFPKNQLKRVVIIFHQNQRIYFFVNEND